MQTEKEPAKKPNHTSSPHAAGSSLRKTAGRKLPDRTQSRISSPDIRVPADCLSGPPDLEELFSQKGLFHIEIGAGRDPFVVELAGKLPGNRIIGFEYSEERISRLARKAARSPVGNIRLLRCEALQSIARFIGPGSVENFYIFFPDPWPKKRHAGNRLVRPEAMRLLATRLVPGGRIFLKTDHLSYSKQMVRVLEKMPFLRNVYGPGFNAPLSGPLAYETLYERKWKARGKKVYPFVYEKTEEP